MSKPMKTACLAALILTVFAVPALAEPIHLSAGKTTFAVDPDTLAISAQDGASAPISLMAPMHPAVTAQVEALDDGWRWTDSQGQIFTADLDHDDLRIIVTAPTGTQLNWPLASAANTDTWLIPDGEGIAFDAGDAFWRETYADEECLGGSSPLSFPAWGRLNAVRTVVYMLGDGLQSQLCLKENNNIQARLTHDFSPGADTVELRLSLHPSDPLAPAFAYRQHLIARNQLKSFADKPVPKLPRLFGAPHAYVWGDGRTVAFLDDLKAVGIGHILLAYDQNPADQKLIAGPAYLAHADQLGYLAGPYEAFDNGQPPATADTPVAVWDDALYPAGCLRDAKGQVVSGFANRGCQMSSEAIARHPGAPSPASRFADHIKEGATQVFDDTDAYGDFYADYAPAHPMTMAKDRDNRLARMGLAISQYHLVFGSENVTGWATGVTHFSHGTGQAHVEPAWMLERDKARFGRYWPSERPERFFKSTHLTVNEARALFGPADRLPLFEAVFHDSIASTDRWEFGLMKIAGQEAPRFARSLLYGTPTIWNFDRAELKRVAPWLKAAHDDFKAAHGWGAPVALTGFAWLTPDRTVQQTTYADGRVLIANFSLAPWQGLNSNCVRLTRPQQAPEIFCPPPLPEAPTAR